MSGWKKEHLIGQPLKEIDSWKIDDLLKLKKKLRKETQLLKKGKGDVGRQQRLYKQIREMGANLVP